MKRVWMINQYNMPPEYGHFNRHYNLGKYLHRLNYEPTVFAGSFLHNVDNQLITNKDIYQRYSSATYPYYFIRTCDYSNNRFKRVYAMIEFSSNVLKLANELKRPDVIIGSTAHPLAAISAIFLAQKYGCQSIVEIRDLWPASFVSHNIITERNPFLKALYAGEKWIYTKADKLIFTMEGGKDYIVDKGWDRANGGPIALEKVYHLNNGVDLEVFNHNKTHCAIDDADLSDESRYRVVYVGSLRRANKQIWKLIEAISLLQGPEYRDMMFLIYGDGSEREKIRNYCIDNRFENVRVKGYVEKRYIPGILSRCDLNILNCASTDVLKYGGSQNKLFDYLASGNPIISGEDSQYSIIKSRGCGIAKQFHSARDLKESILELKNLDENASVRLKTHILEVATDFDFKNLAKKLTDIIEEELNI